MEEIINSLKLAELGYQIATNSDYVPEYSKEEVTNLSENVLEGYTLEDIAWVLKNYEGWSDGDMCNKVMQLVKQLG